MDSARQVRNQILLTTEWNGGEQRTRRTHWIPEWWGEGGECVSGNIRGMRDYGKETCSILNLRRNQPAKSITHSTYKAALYCYWHNSTRCLTQKPHHTFRIPFSPVHGRRGVQVWEGREGSTVRDGVSLLLFFILTAGCLHTLWDVKQLLSSVTAHHEWRVKSKSFQRKKWVLRCKGLKVEEKELTFRDPQTRNPCLAKRVQTLRAHAKGRAAHLASHGRRRLSSGQPSLQGQTLSPLRVRWDWDPPLGRW